MGKMRGLLSIAEKNSRQADFAKATSAKDAKAQRKKRERGAD
jgi:hypothetical protein